VRRVGAGCGRLGKHRQRLYGHAEGRERPTPGFSQGSLARPQCPHALSGRSHGLLNPERACTRWLAAPTTPADHLSTARLTSLRRAPPSVRGGVHSPARVPGTCACSWQGTPTRVPAPCRCAGGLSAHESSRERGDLQVLSINDRLHGPFRGPLEAAHARHRLNRWRRETSDSSNQDASFCAPSAGTRF